MRIGDVAKRTGVSVAAIRYYETLGLLQEPARAPSGFRDLDADAVRRLEFIQRAQALGFSLQEVRQLLDLRQRPSVPALEVRAQVEAKLESVESKIRDLARLRAALQRLRDACCARGGADGECPILDELDGVAR